MVTGAAGFVGSLLLAPLPQREPVVGTELTMAHPAEVTHTLADMKALCRAIGWIPRTGLADLVTRQGAAAAALRRSEPASS